MAIERGMTELVIGGAFLRVAQRLVGLVQLFELGLGVLVARVAIGMAVFGEAPERRLDVLFARPPGEPQYVIVVALGHKLVFRSSLLRRGRALSCGEHKCKALRRPQPKGYAGLLAGRGLAFHVSPQSRRCQADFFLSSFTSSKSASTTFSPEGPFFFSAPPPAPGPASPPPACCAPYRASPSFMEACASADDLALMVSALSLFTASFSSPMADSMRVLSPA